MPRWILGALLVLCETFWGGPLQAADELLDLNLRSRVETEQGSGRYHAVTKPTQWKASETAIVICDMWDDHYCRASASRVAEMAPRMNQVISAARERGVLIIHSPSGCMDKYEDMPQRKLAQSAPKFETKIPLENWCYLDKKHETELPIEDSDPCEDCEPRERVRFYTRQIETLKITPGDAITDSVEAFYLMKQRGIKNVIVMGVHTNMCVLGRPFGIRQLVRQGQNVVLMRDQTDTMYNPAQRPFVSHFTGTDLIVEHIERHWCPTIASTDFLGGDEFRFSQDRRPHLAIVMAEAEYRTRETLPAFALKHLGKDFRVSLVYANAKDRNDIPGIEVLNDADIALLSIRRRTLPDEQFKVVKKFIADGKPLVGIRTASHAFCLRKEKPKKGFAEWPTFDRDILGGFYHNHLGNKLSTFAQVTEGAEDHPILQGINPKEFRVYSSLYLSRPLAKTATALMTGRAESVEQQEPVAWTNERPKSGRVFYTSLGHIKDFEIPAFQTLLKNGIYWAAGLQIPVEQKQAAKSVLKRPIQATPVQATLVAQKKKAAKAEEKSPWGEVDIPAAWKTRRGSGPGNGPYTWYRCQVKVPADWKGRKLELFVEPADDAREAYVNGVRVGASGDFPPKFRSGLGGKGQHAVPASAIQFGKNNVIALRIFYRDGRGGFNVAAPVLFGGNEAIRLEGKWLSRSGDEASWSKLADGMVYDKVEDAKAVALTLKKLQGEEGPLPVAEALKRFKVPEDLEIEVVLSEPEIAQPLSMKWDSRGRLWVVQYLQYPTPAGLKVVSRDKHLRTVYDKVPPAPPNHFRGQDKITIHEDTNGDGVLDKHKAFVDELSLVSSFAIGRGGVWVLNPPYLLFYPDKNHDDVPDGDPEVHLQGFGLEDSHSVANSLRWGPDGWLYATQGSTVSGNITRPGIDKEKDAVHSMGQCVWRYHPESRRYEIFAEGGGNSFGVEIDQKGRIFSGHNGGNTRGFHYVQGGYSRKGFAKHGELSNPFSFGYFDAMKHHNVPRFTHTFVIYDGATLPKKYHGKLFGVEPLQGQVVMSDFNPNGSSFQTRDLSRPVQTNDSWFRPVDIQVGPDGALYVADMYEQRIDHASHYQGRVDKTRGRIYRLKTKGSKPLAAFNLSKLSTADLIGHLTDKNKWYRQTAQRLIGDRKDKSAIPQLQKMLTKSEGQQAIEILWALYKCDGLTGAATMAALDHEDPYVRAWTVRLLCDEKSVSSQVARKLSQMAKTDPHVEVRSQLACSSRRLTASDALPIVSGLLARDEDASDVHLPLLLWWAIEAKADLQREEVLKLFTDPAVWDLPIVRQHILSRIMRRYAQAGSRKDLITCAQLLEQAPKAEHAKLLITGFEQAFQGRSLAGMPKRLVDAMSKAGGASLSLRVRRGDADAVTEALKIVGNEKAKQAERVKLLQVFAEARQAKCVPVLLTVVQNSRDERVRESALAALTGYNEPRIGQTIVALYSKLPDDVRSVAESLLSSRPAWSLLWLDAISSGKIEKASIPMPVVHKMMLLPDEKVGAQVKSLWGDLQNVTTAEMKQKIADLTELIQSGYGNPYDGKKLFAKNCGKCHKLFNEGGQIGPDLTAYKRDDLPRVLLNVVNPSAEIRKGFENFAVLTDDGRVLNGFIADQDNQVVILRGIDGQKMVVARDEIEEMRAVARSVMPEGVLKPLSNKEIQDLFAYLRASQPVN